MKYLLITLSILLISCSNMDNKSTESRPKLINNSYIYNYQDTTDTGIIVKCYSDGSTGFSCVNITDYQ